MHPEPNKKNGEDISQVHSAILRRHLWVRSHRPHQAASKHNLFLQRKHHFRSDPGPPFQIPQPTLDLPDRVRHLHSVDIRDYGVRRVLEGARCEVASEPINFENARKTHNEEKRLMEN